MHTTSLLPVFVRSAAALLLALALAVSAAPPAAAADPVPARVAPAPAAVAAAPLLGDSWLWRNLYTPVAEAINSRARLLQFGFIGVIISLLVIIMGNKWSRK